MSRIVVTGATGLIGSALLTELRTRGDEVVVLSRRPELARQRLGGWVETVEWPDPVQGRPPELPLAGSDAIVNLLGETIAQRWSSEAKARIRDSRILGTRNLLQALREIPDDRRPGVLVSQSASGFYGPRGEEEVDESATGGDDFLAGVVREWEAEARSAEELGLRVALTRTGVVLSSHGGALETMLPPFKAGVGGPVAGGRQYVPWVHVQDVVGAILFCVDEQATTGPVNVAAPKAVTNREFSRALGRALHRPAVMPVPALALKLLYGEMAQIVLTGARLVPRRLEQLGYQFRQPDLDTALRDVLRS